MTLALHLIAGAFAVCRLPASEPVPPWTGLGHPRLGDGGSAVFSSVTRTADELSIICPASRVPAGVKHEAGWRLLKFQGPFAFTATGILASVLTPLAAARISILATATFDTDYLLVKASQLDEARRVLQAAGHEVLE
jgi:hypothetical protein